MKIGITGHQQLEDSAWVKQAILDILHSQLPPLVGVTCLAMGADQLFAQAMLECSGTLQVIVPMEGYAQTFDAQDLKQYRRLLSQASLVEVLPAGVSNEASYLAAGKKVVDLSDLLIAVWDGEPAAGLGGTADIVLYAKIQSKPYIHINPVTRETLF